MIAHHCDSNAILSDLFKSLAEKHRLLAYGAIMPRLKYRNMLVDLQILDNEASTEYKLIIKSELGVRYQLVPPHIQCRNAAESETRNFKANFLSTLARIETTPPNNLWDLLLPQKYLSLNIIRQ